MIVIRVHAPVDDTFAMDIFQGVHNLCRIILRAFRRQGSKSRDDGLHFTISGNVKDEVYTQVSLEKNYEGTSATHINNVGRGTSNTNAQCQGALTPI